MPIYLVRWADLSAALVSAADEADLIDTLDQLANPDRATWVEYDGPLWVEFEVPAEWHVTSAPGEGETRIPLGPDDIVVDDVAQAESLGALRLSIPEADSGWEMAENLAEWAFPHLSKVWRLLVAGEAKDDDALERAVRAELSHQVRASWRTEAVRRASDPLSRLAATFDTSREWIGIQRRRRAGEDGVAPSPHGEGQKDRTPTGRATGRKNGKKDKAPKKVKKARSRPRGRGVRPTRP